MPLTDNVHTSCCFVNHGISYGVYFLDPDGHHLEVFYQHEPDPNWH